MQSRFHGPGITRRPRLSRRAPLPITVLGAMMASVFLALGGAAPVTAQTIECDEQPLLAAFDANDDGVVSVAEIRQADPDDDVLQEYADELEADDVFGVFYRGCDELDGGEGSGDPDDAPDDQADPDDAPDEQPEPEEPPDDESDSDGTPVDNAVGGEPGDDRSTGEADEAGEGEQERDDAEEVNDLGVTTLPGVGHGSSPAAAASETWRIAAVFGAFVAALRFAWRVRTSGF